MKFSQLFFYNNFFERKHQSFELIDLMRKACFVHQDNAGLFSWLSLGLILEQKVEKIVSEEMERAGFTQVKLSLMQDSDLWKETGRINSYGAELFKLRNRKDHEFVLGATCEELITDIVRDYYSHNYMNLHVYQFGNKYRDELRAKAGLMRAKEFIMKDAYSFCSSEIDLEQTYRNVRQAYCNIFQRLGLEYSIVSSDNGEIGGKSSEEFHCTSVYGEAEHSAETTLEIAHIFNLGQEYSQKMNLKGNTGEFVYMGCYGIGISRLVMALLEKQRDEYGFWGTQSFNTYDVVISTIDYGIEEHKEKTESLYKQLTQQGLSVLIDDRNVQAGKKMSDSELIACRYRLIISRQAIQNDQFELLNRQTMSKSFFSFEELKHMKL